MIMIVFSFSFIANTVFEKLKFNLLLLYDSIVTLMEHYLKY